MTENSNTADYDAIYKEVDEYLRKALFGQECPEIDDETPELERVFWYNERDRLALEAIQPLVQILEQVVFSTISAYNVHPECSAFQRVDRMKEICRAMLKSQQGDENRNVLQVYALVNRVWLDLDLVDNDDFPGNWQPTEDTL